MNENPEPASAVMEDFVFGALEADETILARERERWSGLRHQYDILPLDPLPGQPVTISVSAGRDVLVDRVTAFVSNDGREPAGRRGVAEHGMAIPLERIETRWQPLHFDYVELWQGVIPGQPEGTLVRYRIEGWHSEDEEISIWSREMNLDRSPERPTLYGYSVDRFQPPAWAHGAVVYQIFVDRFAPVQSRWLEPEEMVGFAGGNLRGIIDRLDYLSDLGVTALWLTPIFLTDSYHGYDTIDYTEIDPRFGSKADLRELVAQAHSRGLRILLDFVANHASSASPPFQAALARPDSAYRDWFVFDPAYKHGYRCFFDTASMPQFNHDNGEVRAYLFEAARTWLLDFDIDGYRLDYAAGPGHEFWSEFGAVCKQARPDCWLFGEVTLGSDWLRTYAGRLDGCLDFGFTRHVRALCRPGADPEPISRFAAAMERTQRYFPATFTRPTFLDSHDMNRFLWVVGNDRRRLKLGLGLLFAFGGTPILYYGTEVGLGQPRAKGHYREESRHPMLWGEAQDRALLDYVKQLISLRRRHPALVYGEIETLFLDDERGLWLAERAFGDDRVLIAVNSGAAEAGLSLPAGGYRMVWGSEVSGVVRVPGWGVVFLVAR